MCLQCDTQAEIILVDVLPGYNLMRAHVGAARWPEGWYALVQGNDPALVFPGLAFDPTFESDSELPPELEQACDDFMSAIAQMRLHLQLSLSDAASLGFVCRDAGYSRDKHGDIECWLLHYLACKVDEVHVA